MDQKLSSLIAASYTKADAEAAMSFQPSEFAVQQLADAGKEILTLFPYKPGACALMTAMWTAFIRDNTKYPVHAFAGSLFVDGVHVFGSDSTANQTKGAFAGTNLDWDGHCWIVFGNLIGDVSLFRTAYSDASPPALKKKIIAEFGTGRGLFIAPLHVPAERGIIYDAQYALTDVEITGLFNCARTMIESRAGT
jgi:hypothetical protein